MKKTYQTLFTAALILVSFIAAFAQTIAENTSLSLSNVKF